MGRYKEMFAEMEAARRGAFVPFTVIGDPTLAVSLQIIEALVAGGADALELGIPFSDPVADGPVIQAAAVRAIDAGATPKGCFEVIGAVRRAHPEIPIGLLVYANLVVSNGTEAFYAQAEAAGVDSVLVADLPVFEAGPFNEIARRHRIAPVFIAPPNAGEAQLKQIAKMTEGYTYVVARSGVTGCDRQVEVAHKSIFGQLKEMGAPPAILGFGISTPDHVRAGLAAGAAGVISGSAVVRRVEEGVKDIAQLATDLSAYVKSMKAATTATP